LRIPIRKRSASGDEAGFTLIEVMIAFVIMGLGLLTIGLAQLTAMRMTTRSRHMQEAMYLAQEQLELFQVSTTPLPAGTFQDPGNPIEVDPNDRDLANFNRSWTVTPNTPQAGLASVSVTVLWNQPQGQGAGPIVPQTVTINGIIREVGP
jgi:type IV pilus assembly protein PilV